MQHYKAPDNSLHCIDPEYAHLLPAGCVPITDEEAEALRPKPTGPTYIDLRRSEYPPIEDYLDSIVKNDESQKQAYIDACLAVKAKYPKA